MEEQKMKDMMSKMSEKSEPDDKYEAKMSVLNELRDMAMNMMGEKVRDRLPSDSHNAMKQVSGGYDLKLDSDMPHQGSNGSEMDKAAGEVKSRIDSFSRHEPMGDQGEPDHSHKNLDYMSKSQGLVDSSPDDDDMSDEEIDSMIAELHAKKAAKSSPKA